MVGVHSTTQYVSACLEIMVSLTKSQCRGAFVEALMCSNFFTKIVIIHVIVILPNSLSIQTCTETLILFWVHGLQITTKQGRRALGLSK
jgi:small basic protein